MRTIHGALALCLTTIAVGLFAWATWHLVRSFPQERRKTPRGIQLQNIPTEHRVLH